MRVGIVGIQHESNTFIGTPTTRDDFEQDVLAEGSAVRDAFARTPHEIGGFLEGLEREGIEPVPVFAARALPGGIISDAAMRQLVKRMVRQFDAAGDLDGLLVAPHGAAVSGTHRDMDGHWLGVLRERIGPDRPMISTLDAHANVSNRMVNLCDATILYRTNPHLDQRERGLEAANLMARTLRGEVRPTQAAALVPVVINIERQHTSSDPCASMYAEADRLLQRTGVLSDSVILGFPYADVEEMGSGFVVVTNGDRELAATLADELAEYLMAHRDDFVADLVGIDAALDEAERSEGPVCLLDMGDNIGGGSPGDGTLIAREVQGRGGPSCFVCLFDPVAAGKVAAAGAGARLSLKMGGRTDPFHGPPLQAAVEVVSVHDGRFTEPEVRHGGHAGFEMGPTAVVRTDAGLTVMLNSRRTPPFSLEQLYCCDVDPGRFQLLVAKGVQAPVAAYAPVCKRLIRVNTPGVTTADMNALKYSYRRRPLFPFEPLDREVVG